MTVLALPPTSSSRRAPENVRTRPLTGPWITAGLDSIVAASAAVVAAFTVHGGSVGLAATVAVVWLTALGLSGSYRPGESIRCAVRPVVRALGAAAAVVAVPALLADSTSRHLIAAELVTLTAASAVSRLLLRLGAVRRRRGHRVVLVGSAEGIERARHEFASGGRGRVDIVAVPWHSCSGSLVPSPRRSGEQDRVRALLDAVDVHDADVVLLCAGADLSPTDSRRLAWALADRQVELLLGIGSYGAHRSRAVGVALDGVSAIALTHPQLHGPARFVKSAAERTLAGLGVVVLAPLLAVIAAAIRLTSPGPALFRQSRTGLNGQPFVVYKFRTMREGSADQFLALAEAAGQSSLFFKLEADPRITRLGALLRKTSLDELPQLFNVVLGNMALVGPRPLPTEVDQSDVEVARRLRALPGITGQWQVSGRSSVKGQQAVEHDIDYVDNWRLGLDVSILRRTARAVLRSDGAY